MEKQDVVQILKNEYVKRVQNNPRYSLRAFAQLLNVDQSLLSKVLAGKRPATAQFAEKVLRQIAVKPLGGVSYSSMNEGSFHILSEWHYFALLELIQIPQASTVNTKRWAKLLDITELEVSMALENLEKLGYIKRHKTQILVQSPSNTWLNESQTSAARKALQRKLLEKAIQGIDEVPFEERDNSSVTVACDPEILPQVKEKIKKFRRELDQFIESKGHAKRIYTLCIAFFPISKNILEERK